ncbi:GGDEF domain-containing protein, partial [Candidatus Uhrbacteria bacterium]|nr:GGDEF domain-containing protein [Candidatus Uhrbacteria bacterium]
QGTLWETAFGKVLADLRVRYEKDGKYAKQLQGFVADKVKAEHGLSVYERRSSAPPGAELPADKPVTEFVAPKREDATEGLRIITALEAEAQKPRENPQEQRVAEKKLARERAMRDYATGLELRGQMFKKLEGAMEDPSKRIASVSMDMGFLKYFDQVGGRETGDMAILKVAEVFQKVKDAFSKEGIDVSVHRLGGDEFGMSVIGESTISPEDFRTKLRELQAALYREIERAGRIPPSTGAKPGYFASKLNIGIGMHVYEDGKAAEAEDALYGLTEKAPDGLVEGLPGYEAWKRNQRADHMVKVADKVMEFQKASNRLMLLVEKMKGIQDLKAKNGAAEDIRREEEHLKQLLAFSDKAIFGQKGRERLGVAPKAEEGEEESSGVHQKTWMEQLAAGATPEELDGQINEFVWDMMDKAFQQEVKEHEALENHVSYAVRIEYLSGRIRELEARLKEGGDTSEKLKEKYAHEQQKLQQKLKAAEEDLEGVRAARAAISG